MSKYVCMKEGDHFCTENEEDAYEHALQGKGHFVVMIEYEDGEITSEVLEVHGTEVPEGIAEE